MLLKNQHETVVMSLEYLNFDNLSAMTTYVVDKNVAKLGLHHVSNLIFCHYNLNAFLET